MAAILQNELPYDPILDVRPLPGVQPLDPDLWLLRDDVYAAQMAERDRLIQDLPDKVMALENGADPAADELLTLVLTTIGEDPAARQVTRPDGVSVPIDRADPMRSLGRLVQEDLCILEKEGAEHVLTAAALCFPSGWTLSEKINRPMMRIHVPIPEYDDAVGRRVQRLFDGVQVGRPLWRFNAHWYDKPTLFAPQSESEPRTRQKSGNFLRSERQCMVRLPETRAVVFSIHTYMISGANIVSRARMIESTPGIDGG